MKTVVLELTTKCNFTCDYCYSKKYADDMMSFDLAKTIIDEWGPKHVRFSLSGEGESILHPKFWDIVKYIRSQYPKSIITTISNGSTLSKSVRDNVIKYLNYIMISLDTVDASVASNIGRLMLPKVLSNVEKLAKVYRGKIIILTTDFGQPLVKLHEYIRSLPFGNAIKIETQPLQTKVDYITVYTKVSAPVITYPVNIKSATCEFIKNESMVFYSAIGQKMPCCFIKDRTILPSYSQLTKQLSDPSNTEIPKCCTGCKYLKIAKPVEINRRS